MDILPAGSVTRRDGVLNISAHTPVNANPPDLGPKGASAAAQPLSLEVVAHFVRARRGAVRRASREKGALESCARSSCAFVTLQQPQQQQSHLETLEPRTDALPHHTVRAGYFSEISDDGEGGNGSTKLHSASVFRSRPSPAGGSPSEPHADVLILDPARTVVSALLLSWPYSLDLSREC